MKVIRSPLTVSDGLRFGCGFLLAQLVLLVAWFAGVVLFAGVS